MVQRRNLVAFSLLSCLAAAGCGRDMAQVHGTVTYDGQPVTRGAVVFSPIPAKDQTTPGKSSTGDIQPDGSFQLSTHRLHDGAYVGQHRVRFIRSLDDDKKKGDPTTPAAASYANLTLPDGFKAEVKSGGENEINIELIKRAPR